MKHKRTLILGILFNSTIAMGAPADLPYIESIVGGDSVQVTENGQNKTLAIGDPVNDQTTLSPQATAVRVAYADGSTIIVAGQTEVFVSHADKVPVWKVVSGLLRAHITKNPQIKKVRFKILAPSSVVGVRGTEFYVEPELGGASTQVHAMEGQLELAKDDDGLAHGKGIKLNGGEAVKASSGGFTEIEKFDKEAFRRHIEQRDPRFKELQERKLSARKELVAHAGAGKGDKANKPAPEHRKDKKTK